jgi:hypothetical protein
LDVNGFLLERESSSGVLQYAAIARNNKHFFLNKQGKFSFFKKAFCFFNSFKEAVSKVRHPALDAGSPEKRALSFRGLRVKPAMTSTHKGLLKQPLCRRAFPSLAETVKTDQRRNFNRFFSLFNFLLKIKQAFIV